MSTGNNKTPALFGKEGGSAEPGVLPITDEEAADAAGGMRAVGIRGGGRDLFMFVCPLCDRDFIFYDQDPYHSICPCGGRLEPYKRKED